jgi:hypothetical protein
VQRVAKVGLELSGRTREVQSQGREDLRLDPQTPLNRTTYENVRAREAPAYEDVKQAGWGDPRIVVPEPATQLSRSGEPFRLSHDYDMPHVERPGLKVEGTDFVRDVGARAEALRAKLDAHPEGFKSLSPSLNLLDEVLAKKEFNPNHAVDLIQQLRRDADVEIGAPKVGHRRDGAHQITTRQRPGTCD